MFPSNLHKNIVQLDKQISLLENECKNMEIEKRKKGVKLGSSQSRCSKYSNAQLKPSTVKIADRKSIYSNKSKLTPPVSARLQSTCSMPSQCSKTWSDNDEILVGGKPKLTRLNLNTPARSCHLINNVPGKVKTKSKYSQNGCCNGECASDLAKYEGFEKQGDEVLHKELIFSNPDGTIEVTVTQKPCNGKEGSQIRKIINLEKPEKDTDSCGCQNKGQKWSEILCENTYRKSEGDRESIINKLKPDGSKHSNFTNNRGFGDVKLHENCNNNEINTNHLPIQEETYEVPVRLVSPSLNITKQPQLNSRKYEDIQYNSEREGLTDIKDPVKLFHVFINQLKQIAIGGQNHQSLSDRETTYKKSPYKEPLKKQFDDTIKISDVNGSAQNNFFIQAVKQHCENLIKEKESLTKELELKNDTIATMNKREEEYLSVISGLKSSLEKAKESAQEGAEALKEVAVLKNKLLEQMKVSETIKKSYNKLQKTLEQFVLENDKLKTKVKILKLESQKHDVLLAGKDAEIGKYKEEIQNFQRQITEHLASIRSNSQGIDIEKMIENIFQKSQIFFQNDGDSVVVEREQKDSKLQNVLMHSSPTSTKNSVVNSSWKQISSIHDHSRANSEPGIHLNEDHDAKDFIQIFGGSSSPESKPRKKTLMKNLLNNEPKAPASFTSCMSACEDDRDDSSTTNNSSSDNESLTTKDETLSNKEMGDTSRTSFEKAQTNIDEVLKKMKLKFSKQIFETSLTNYTNDDFPDSQISSISQ